MMVIISARAHPPPPTNVSIRQNPHKAISSTTMTSYITGHLYIGGHGATRPRSPKVYKLKYLLWYKIFFGVRES